MRSSPIRIIDLRIVIHGFTAFSWWRLMLWRRSAQEDADSASWVNDWEIWIGPVEIRKGRDWDAELSPRHA